jgi:photosystem II stability/assembly factor-like uncharacterized protein
MTLSMPIVAMAASSDTKEHDSSIYNQLKLRNIGPAVTGGRISDFAFNTKNPAQYFVATASGGLWKTDNAGVTWKAIADSMPSYSYGDVTMDPNNSSVIWAGTGENNSQRSVAYGDGVYKSVDGGNSWNNVGLKNSEHISEILIDPRDSDVVYAASQGPLWSKGGDRGLYKTTDGGNTWSNVLEISQHTGVSDIAFDPENPDVLYATSYQRRRHVWTLINGGPESTIYKSTDAGKTWKKINKGLPSVDLGRIGIDVAPSDANIVYAIVEAADGKSGFYRSTDKGASWTKQSSYVSGSPQYYQEIVVDPKNPHRVYSLDTYLMVSENGGKTFTKAGEAHKHVDNHALWIDPQNTNHLIIGSDGGVYESWDRAKNWSFKDNMPLTQFYKVTVDNDYPFYNVFGGTQDNASLGAPHRTTSSSGIQNSDWLFTQFGDGFKTVIDPTNPDIIYSQYQYGGLARYDKKSGERVQMQPVSPDPLVAQRFNWNSPLLISQHNNERIYYGSQTLFQSDNQGNDWRAISGDLSRNIDRNKLKVMDKVWGVDTVAKNTSTSFYGSLIALTESPRQEGLLYTGSDDGVMHVTKNGGQQWDKLDWPSKVPDNSYVADMEASQFATNTVFAVFDNHKQGDFKPYVYRSDNNGKRWKNITGDLPLRGSSYAIAQDHINKDLLFVGTEFGVFFSQNAGKNWVQLKSGLPTIAVRDIVIQRRESDLALATFGRGFYILDDYSPLRENATQVKKQQANLFPVRRSFQFVEHNPLGLPGKSMRGADFYFADNPEFGATFSYFINEDFKSLKAKRQSKEKQLRKDNKPLDYPSYSALKEEDFEQQSTLLFTVTDSEGNMIRRIKAPAKKGFNRIHWDLRYPGFDPIDVTDKIDGGWFAVPGNYSVALSKVVNGVETSYGQSQNFEVVSLDNRTFASSDRDDDLKFDKQVGRLYQTISGARKYLNELESRIKHVKVAVTETLGLTQNTLESTHNMQRELEEIKLLLNGNSVLAKRAKPTVTSVYGYISYLVWSRSESTSAVNGQQKLRFARASEGYAKVYLKIKQLADSVALTEQKIAKADGSWLPGMMPSDGQ